MLLAGHVACRATSANLVHLCACEHTCMRAWMHVCLSIVQREDDRKRRSSGFESLCVQGVFVSEIFGGNWSKPKWTPWLLGRMLHPAERDLGQRRGLYGLRRRDWGVTPSNVDKWVPTYLARGEWLGSWMYSGHWKYRACRWHVIAVWEYLIQRGQTPDVDRRNVLARLCS